MGICDFDVLYGPVRSDREPHVDPAFDPGAKRLSRVVRLNRLAADQAIGESNPDALVGGLEFGLCRGRGVDEG